MPTFKVSPIGFRLFFTVDPTNVKYIFKNKIDNYLKVNIMNFLKYVTYSEIGLMEL